MTQIIDVFDIGDSVVCDLCSNDYTNSDECGGFLFGGKGVCPKCADDFMVNVKKYHEEEYIKATCPPDKTFKQFIMEIRGGNNTVTIGTF
jgi:hypothetical protein